MHDVFISYASADKPIADAACAVLENRSIRCWIAPRDVTPGLEWGAEIVRAIKEAAVMVLIYSRNANASTQVKREVERAVSRGIPVVPFRIEDVPASETLEFFISTPHWLDALTPPMEKHLTYLAETVDLLRARFRQGDLKTPSGPTPRVPSPPPASAAPGSSAPPSMPAGAAGTAAPSLAASLWKPAAEAPSGGSAPNAAAATPPPVAPAVRAPWSPRARLRAGAAVFAVAVVGWFGVQYSRSGDLREWAGTWTTDNVFQGVPAHWELVIDWNRNYRSSVETRDQGPIRFAPGGSLDNARFTMETATGRPVNGSFRQQGPHSAQIAGPYGSVTWTRKPGSATAGTESPVGEWTASRLVSNVQWSMVFRVTSDGRFEFVSRAEDEGRFAVGEERGQKRWYLHSTRGASQEGTYERIDGRTVSMRGPLGTAVWAKH
jgi:hypothetical protein